MKELIIYSTQTIWNVPIIRGQYIFNWKLNSLDKSKMDSTSAQTNNYEWKLKGLETQ